jgi:peptidyl-tRNA hydrolase
MAAVGEGRFVALFDYDATPQEEADEDDEPELSFKAGQTILVTDTEDADWFTGYLEGTSKGESGVFPATYVRPSESGESSSSQQRSEEGVPPASASRTGPDYASLLDSYDGTKALRGSQSDANGDAAASRGGGEEKSEIDVYFDVETADGGHAEVSVSVRRTETMQAVTQRIAAAVGRSREDVCELLELAAGSERQTVAEASPSLSLPWRQALTDEDNRFVVPRAATSRPRSSQQAEPARTASHDSLEQLLVTEVSQLEDQRARLSAQLCHAEAELASSSLRCTELQTECMGFQSEFVGMSRDHGQLSVDHRRLTEQCQQQAERLQQMTSEYDAMRVTVLQAHAATATELSVSKVMEQLEDELYRLQCALGDSVDEQQQQQQHQQQLHVVTGDAASARTPDLAAASTTDAARSLEEQLNALQSEYDELQSACERNEEEHTREIERLESEHAAAMSAQREDSIAVIERLSAEHSRVVKHLQEDAAYATAIAAGGGNDTEDESAELMRRHRDALRALQAGHDVEMARLREEHAEQLARHTQELEAVSFLVEVPLVKPLASGELRDVAAMMASEYLLRKTSMHNQVPEPISCEFPVILQ